MSKIDNLSLQVARFFYLQHSISYYPTIDAKAFLGKFLIVTREYIIGAMRAQIRYILQYGIKHDSVYSFAHLLSSIAMLTIIQLNIFD